MAIKMISKPQIWGVKDRSGLAARVDGDVIEKLVSVPLDPEKPNDDHFDLYYCVRTPREGLAEKTILFCAGGPGEIVRTSDETIADFLTEAEYNVVSFHLRGSGFSQIPPANLFDRFLKTSYAVEDIEEIRKDFLGEEGKWAAIIGYSYGTVLAHQYAHFHSCRLGKLILVAPISRHMFKASGKGFDDFAKNVRMVHRINLESIYDGFKDLQGENGRAGKKEKILAKLFDDKDGIFQTIENAFGSIQFVIDTYDDLKEQLKKYELDKYSRNFFLKLRELRHVGSSDFEAFAERRFEIGKVIRNELLNGKRVDDRRSNQHIQDSQRVFYAMTVQDGVNPRFLKELLSRESKDAHEALVRSGGEAHVKCGVNRWLKTLGIDSNQQIEPWDPAAYQHSVPTLILTGQADPVTAGEQAHYFYSKALTGPRTFIELPGIGHEISLPFVNNETPLASGMVRLDPTLIPSQKVRAVTGYINGLKVNKRLRIDIDPMTEQRSKLKVVALAKIYQEKGKEEKGGILALFKNAGDRLVIGKQTDWRIGNDFFSGTVRFDVPTIKPREQRRVYGRLVYAGRNPQRELRLKHEGDLEPGIEVLGFMVDPPPDNFVTIWLLNKRDKTVRLGTRRWTIGNSFFKKSFTLTSDDSNPIKIKKNKVFQAFAIVDGLPLDKDDDLDFTLPGHLKSLEACISPEDETSSRLEKFSLDRHGQGFYQIPISIRNKGSKFDGNGGEWHIDNPVFSVTLQVGRLRIDAGSGIKTFGRITGVTWKKVLQLIEPPSLERGLELIGFNILAEDRLSVLIGNKGSQLVNGAARDWVYVDPRRDELDLSEGNESDELWRDKLLNRLIYSFLFLDAEQFKAAEENELLDAMPGAFRDNLPIKQLVGPIKRRKEFDHLKREPGNLDIMSSSKLEDDHSVLKGARL